MEKNSTGCIVLGILGILAICFCLVTALVALLILLPSRSNPTPTPNLNSTSPEPNLSTEIPRATEDARDGFPYEEAPMADLPDIAERLLGLEEIPRVLSQEAAPIPVGTVQEFWISDANKNESELIEASLVYTGEVVYFWVDTRVEVDLEDVERIVTHFEEDSYPTIHSLIGTEWNPGVDGDPHLYVLYTRGIGSSVAGLFYPKDEYSTLVHEYSNGHEMFYLSADNVSLDSGYIESVLAHEFQHMVHWNIDRDEDTWMNEGLSELVELVLGFEIGGFDYLYSFDTDKPLTRWPSEPGSAGEHYGQVFLFLTYLYDRFGEEMIRAIASNPGNGLVGIEQALNDLNIIDPLSGDLIKVEDIFLDWAVSLVLQDPGLADGRYGLQSYTNAPSPSFNDTFDRCPVSSQERTVNQFGIDLIKITCQGNYRLEFSADTMTKVFSGDPHSGEYAFWSNAGDTSDMTLTNAFDFREASGSIFLEYWVWYKIEEGYDYVYLEVSTDGGETWQILQTPSGTGEDPSGSAFGWGYNGISGNGSQPMWIKERVDLSAYAGQEILLRFEYVTDSAVNTEGLLLDDVSIESIGYFEHFEEGDGGWQAEGFIRVQNRIPQTFRLAIIERGQNVVVTEIAFDTQNRAEYTLTVREGLEDLILVVTATSDFSWLPAEYQLEILQ